MAAIVPIWYLTPVLDSVSISTWRWLGVLAATLVGGASVSLTRSWSRTTWSIAVGLVAGVAILDLLTPSDVGPPYPTVGTVSRLLMEQRTELLAALASSSFAAWLFGCATRSCQQT